MTRFKGSSISSSRKAMMAFTALGLFVCSGQSFASSHREAPNITGSPRVDGTDLYAFQSYSASAFVPGTTNRYTTIIANYNPSEDPGAGPNYYALDPNAIYEIHVDSTGRGIEDKTFRFQFSQALAGGSGLAATVGGDSVAIPLKVGAPITTPGNTTTSPAGLNFIQTYTVQMTTGDRASNGNRQTGTTVQLTDANNSGSATFTKPMDNVGTKSFPNGYVNYANVYNYQNVTLPGCAAPVHLFVGQRSEAFAVNLNHVFDLVNVGANKLPIDSAAEASDAATGGMHDAANGIAKSTANNALTNKNITSIAMEIPTECLTGETGATLTAAGAANSTHNGVIGLWTTASLPQAQLLNPNATFALPTVNGGAYTQVSRLGMPLVNELVIGLKDKDHFNASKPINDTQFATYVTNPTLPTILQSLFGPGSTLNNAEVTAPTNFPRTDLETAFLTGVQGVNQLATVTPSEMLRLNTNINPTATGSQNSYGLIAGDTAGFPNGRRPGDETVDITLRVAMGKLCAVSGTAMVTLNGTQANCNPAHAPSGDYDFTDGAMIDTTKYTSAFPYLATPISGD